MKDTLGRALGSLLIPFAGYGQSVLVNLGYSMKSWVDLLNAFKIRLQPWISVSACINQTREDCFYLNQVRNGEVAGV